MTCSRLFSFLGFLTGSLILPAIMRGEEPQPLVTAKRDGLVLTISLSKGVYRFGEEITLNVILKNESGNELFIGDGFLAPNLQEVGPGRHFELHTHDENATRLRFWSAAMTEGGAAGIRRVFRLKPGESYDASIYLVANGERFAESNEFRFRIRSGIFATVETDRRHELGKDGHRYSVSVRYQVDPKSHSVWEPPTGFHDNLLWKGTIDAPPLQFTVEPPGASTR